MKKNILKAAAACGLCLTLLVSGISASATYTNNTKRLNNRAGFNQEAVLRNNPMNEQRMNPMDGRMIISEPGDYTLTGDMRGMVYVDPGEGEVRLTLDGAQLDGANGPAITAVSGDRLTIKLPQGSMNSVAGGRGSDFGAAIYSEIPVFFEGDGRLDMVSEAQDAIRVASGDLNFNGGDIRVEAQGNGFNAQNVNFNGGAVAVDAAQNSVAPGAQQNMNGGQFNQSFAPSNDFMRSAQPSGGQFDASANQQQNGPMNGQTPESIRQNGQTPSMPEANQQNGEFGQQAPTAPGGEQNSPFSGQQQNGAAQSSTDTAGEIVTGIAENSAMSLTADYDNATTYDVSENSTVKIKDSGTYIVTGTSENGSITVTKGTTDVVLVLENLDLTSTSGATLSINKNAEVQVVISGNVTLTDNENPNDEYSEDTDVADAYDGAAIKVKAGSVAFITGDGTLTVNGNAKNGIKAGDESSLIIGGDVTVNINAVNDGINGNYDVTILSGDVTISAGDDGIHADHILTIGENGIGPNLTISKSTEGLEGTVVNIAGGKVNVTASDDGVNAANGDGVYEGELDYSVNITGGDVTIKAGTDGIDSNGNVNLIGGSATIKSANNGGDAGIDYDGELYISDGFGLNNSSGVAGPDNMMGGPDGQMGGMGGQMGSQPGQMGGSFSGPTGGQPGDMGGGFRR